MNAIEFGKFIARLRNEKGLTQEELAEKLFIDKRKISRWECGTSMPEFDMLIKLSEILDVSLYELSICKKIENENLKTTLINKFINIKDFRKYKAKKKTNIVIAIILFIILIITTVYTIKYNGTVEIYELKSMNEKYSLEGNYVHAKNYSIFNINSISVVDSNKNENQEAFKNCEYEVLDNSVRLFHIIDSDKNYINSYKTQHYYNSEKDLKIKKKLNIKIKCTINNKVNNYSFDIKLIKKYDNKLFKFI